MINKVFKRFKIHTLIDKTQKIWKKLLMNYQL